MAASPAPSHNFNNIPQKIRDYNQWLLWKYVLLPAAAKPTKVPFQAKKPGEKANVTNPNHWSSFDQAVATYNRGGFDGIGFSFTENDPFCFIDLDDVRGNALLEKMHSQIIAAFETYAERSPSGYGTHIICEATIEAGTRSSENQAEIYTSGRYATFTGDRINNFDITEQQKLADMLYASIHNKKTSPKLVIDNTKSAFIDKPATRSDEDVIAAASNGKNGELFRDLYNGDWHKHKRYQNANGSGNQSVADQAIFNFLYFYSGNQEQMIRLFHSSMLGRRQKAFRQNYLMPMIENSADWHIEVAPDVLAIPDDFRALIAAQEARGAETNLAPEVPEAAPNALPKVSGADKGSSGQGQQHQAAPASDSSAHGIKSTPDFLLSPPPGLLGEVARYIYGASTRPVPHISLAAAIGLMAGICGRSFNCSKPSTGLNQYILLLAETGRGKEAMKQSINAIIKAMSLTNLTAPTIMGPGKINSGQALRPYLENNKCFVTIQSEFDSTYAQMVNPNANSAAKALKQELLDLYMASGKDAQAEASIYSDDKKNVASIKSPAITLLAECTIESMNAILDERQVKDGLLTRFLNITYDGPRVPKNESAGSPPPIDLIMKLCALHTVTNEGDKVSKVIQIEASPEAHELLEAFNLLADEKINDANASTFANLWNRAHLKALKLAALLCASDYAQTWSPFINKDQAAWAISLVKHDIENIIQRFETHQVGDQSNENAQNRDLKKLIVKFVRELPTLTEKQCETYRINQVYRMNCVMPMAWLQMKTANVSSFKNDKLGASKALERALKALSDIGVIYDVTRDPSCKEKYGSTAKAFAITDRKWFAGV